MTLPFQQKESIDKPGIVGARWWQESLATQVPRRQAVTGIVALGGVLAAIAAIGTCASRRSYTSSSSPSLFGSSDDVRFEPRRALDMQREYGWSFGAADEALVFDGRSTKPFDRAALAHIGTDLSPGTAAYAPFFVPTLFESLTAVPKSAPSGDSSAITPLRDALVPISTPATETAFKQGQALASLLDKEPRAKDIAVIVDLPGPEAVAFAAGASSVLDPIFLFDNWPHPRGVVPAHMTLASAAYYQPLFAGARASRAQNGTRARPLFVLDRNRLAKYADESTQFDNRHVARVPSASGLTSLGVKNVLYVPPNAVQRQELDDLVDDFVAYSTSAKIALHVVPATGFEPASTDPSGPCYYGGSPTAHRTFWTHLTSPPTGLSSNDLELYTPKPRSSSFSSTSGRTTRPTPEGFGMVPVAIAVGTGAILGARLSRNGSWNRTSSSSSGS